MTIVDAIVILFLLLGAVLGFKKDCVMKRFVVKFAKWYFTTTAEAYK